MVISITSTSTLPVSTDLGIIRAGQTITATLPPDKAQQAAYNLTGLVNAGRLTVVLLDDPNLLPVFESSGGGATATETSFVATAASGQKAYSMSAGARLSFASDASAYLERNASNQLHTPGSLVVDGTLTVAGSVISVSGTNTGDVTLAAVGSAPSANGASLSGQVLTLQPADGTHPGLLTTAAQTLAGAKTFSNGVLSNSVGASSASVLSLMGAPTDGASAVGAAIGSSTTLANAAAKLLSIKNNSTEKLYVDFAGNLVPSVSNTNTLGLSGTSWNDLYINRVNCDVYKTQDTSHTLLTGTGSALTQINGDTTDGASAVVIVLNSNRTISTSGAKLVSIQNNATEKAFFDLNGGLSITGTGSVSVTGGHYLGINGSQTDFGFLYAGSQAQYAQSGQTRFIFYDANNGQASFLSGQGDGAGVAALKINTSNALTTSGDKLLSLINHNVEKAFVDFAGKGSFAAGTVLGNMTYNNNQILATGSIQLFPGTAGQLQLYGNQNPGAGATNPNVLIGTNQTATGTDTIVNFANNGTVKASISQDGIINTAAGRGGGTQNWFTAGTDLTIGWANSNSTLYTSPGVSLRISGGSEGNQDSAVLSLNYSSDIILQSGGTNRAVLRTGRVLSSGNIASFQNLTTEKLSVDLNGRLTFADYSDQSGSPGNATANTITGRAAIASTASTCVVSNTRVNANSIILLQMESDGTAVSNVVLDSKSAGTSFTVKAVNGTGVVSVTTGTTIFSWIILN